MKNSKILSSKYLPLFLLGAAIVSAPTIGRLCNLATHGFTVEKISQSISPFPFKIAFCNDQKSTEEALNQSFHFLNSGGQCFVFESEDKKYVLKLIDNSLYNYPFIMHLAPTSSKLRKKDRIAKRAKRDLGSYFIATTKLAEECGLIAVKIGGKHTLKKQITLYDNQYIEHKVNLQSCNFILQKKSELLYPYIKSLMGDKKVDLAKKAIEDVLDLYFVRCEKGIFDEDAKIHRNLGFVNDKPIFVDVGRFIMHDRYILPEVQIEDLKAITKRFNEWLAVNYPELSTYLVERIHDYETKLMEKS